MTITTTYPTAWAGDVALTTPAEAWLAPYAMRSDRSAGRQHAEPPLWRAACYQEDRDRIVRSAAFRRLSAKTQVFMGETGDYHRTRLTHTMEVAAVARRLGRALRLNEDLIEALALAHDLGHPPFGHSGEATLNACLAAEGGFCHNRHGLRLVEELELLRPEHPGLNLTRETLDGQSARIDKTIAPPRPLLETQVVDAADSITYDTHDADDAVELGLLELDDLLTLPLWRDAAARVRRRWAGVTGRALRQAILTELLHRQLEDVFCQTHRALEQCGVASIDDLPAEPLVEPSAALAEQKAQVEAFLYQRVYRHPQVLARRAEFQKQVAELFAALVADPQRMPSGFRSRLPLDGVRRTVGDYLAGMTDRYLSAQHARWCAA